MWDPALNNLDNLQQGTHIHLYSVQPPHNSLSIPSSLPPNGTIGLSTAPTTSTVLYAQKLRSLGLSAASIQKMNYFDWRWPKDPNGKSYKGPPEDGEKRESILTKPMNQGNCGNCYAVASNQSFADRWIILNKTKHKDIKESGFNPLLTTVCSEDAKCAGGLPENCQIFFEEQGAVLNITVPGEGGIPSWEDYCNFPDKANACCIGCNPSNNNYTGDKPKITPSLTCDQLKTGSLKRYKAVKNGMKANTVMKEGNLNVNIEDTIANIKADILNHGPVVAKFAVYDDFFDHKLSNQSDLHWATTNHIYVHGSYDTQSENPSEKQDGFHAVVIVGWYEPLTGIPYWIVKNSWGETWNVDGHFNFGMYYTKGQKTPVNVRCGMDIPIQINGSQGTQLFGGTISYLPTEQKSAAWALHDNEGSTKTIHMWIWIVILIVSVIIIGYFLYKKFNLSLPSFPSLKSTFDKPKYPSQPRVVLHDQPILIQPALPPQNVPRFTV